MGAVVLIYDRTKKGTQADESVLESPVDRQVFSDADAAARWLLGRGFRWQGRQWNGPKKKIADLIAWREFPRIGTPRTCDSSTLPVLVVLYLRLPNDGDSTEINMKIERLDFPNADEAASWLSKHQFAWLGDLWHREGEVAEIVA